MVMKKCYTKNIWIRLICFEICRRWEGYSRSPTCYIETKETRTCQGLENDKHNAEVFLS